MASNLNEASVASAHWKWLFFHVKVAKSHEHETNLKFGYQIKEKRILRNFLFFGISENFLFKKSWVFRFLLYIYIYIERERERQRFREREREREREGQRKRETETEREMKRSNMKNRNFSFYLFIHCWSSATTINLKSSPGKYFEKKNLF